MCIVLILTFQFLRNAWDGGPSACSGGSSISLSRFFGWGDGGCYIRGPPLSRGYIVKWEGCPKVYCLIRWGHIKR